MANRDVDSVQSLTRRPPSLLTRVLLWLCNKNPVLTQLYKRISPDMPSDLESTPIPDVLSDGAEVDLYNYDEGHAGRFTVPSVFQRGASLATSHVLSQPDIPQYIASSLIFPSPLPSLSNPDLPAHPIPIFSPGLNTLHQPATGETTTPQRLDFYVRVLMRHPLAQLHMGTSMDQGDVIVDATCAPILRSLLWLAKKLMPSQEILPEVDGVFMTWQANAIDSFQAALSTFNLIDTPLKRSFRSFLHNTTHPINNPCTLLVYSRASIEARSALDGHIDQSRRAGESASDIYNRLRDRVTIVTIGVATRDWPDGPRYVHISARGDAIVAGTGFNADNPRGCGKDALVLTCDSPYNPSASDNHNFCSVTSQFLSLILEINEASSFSALWQLHMQHKVSVPDNIQHLINCLVVLSKGRDWLWNADEAMDGVSPDVFPETDEAREALVEAVGEEFVARLIEAIP